MKTAGKVLLALVAIGVFLYFFDVRWVDGRIEISRRDDSSRARIDRAVGKLGQRAAEPARPAPTMAKEPPKPGHRDVPKRDREALESILEEAE